ncbi:hypothetical protein [Shewanella spartinae]|uniref:hypothetical protein n=1 Tax=Shewanella spartinae TaxID=2864205 RepID=UPI001C654C2D|nr:hypothetical protein [Shewanella spartinae]QYJ95430.1 hypothetical protein K0I31_08755 [Shewanella spartinae]
MRTNKLLAFRGGILNIGSIAQGNFYIFCTLFGLSLIVSSLTYYASQESAYQEAYIAEKRNFAKIEYVVSKLKLEVAPLLKAQSGKPFEEKFNHFASRTDDLHKKISAHAVEAEYLSLLYKQKERAFYLLLIAFFVGTLVTIFGCYNWYSKVQKLSDKLKLQEIKANKAIQPTANAAAD